jgi:hypothetical protein
MEFVGGNVRPSTSAPCGRRDVLTTGPGPDAGGSKPGKEGWDHTPEKSGIAARPTAGPAVCAKTGVAAATANITSEPKSRRLRMTTSLPWFVREISPSLSPSRDFVPV